MASDGLRTNWSFDQHRDLWGHHPSLIAGVLYRELERGRDDATVVVLEQTVRRGSSAW